MINEKMKEEVQVSDNHILQGEPLKLMKYGKVLTIRQVNWFYEWDDFSYNLAVFLTFYNQTIEAALLPRSFEELDFFKENIKIMISKTGIISKTSNSRAFDALCKICAFSGASIRWMKKKFSIDDWIEVFLYFYLYNIASKKKDLKTVFDMTGIAQYTCSQLKPKYSSGSRIGSPSRN